MDTLQATRTAWEANRILCTILEGEKAPKPWAAVKGQAWEHLYRNVLYRLENPEETPEQSHDRFVSEKLAVGWKFGTVKNAQKRTSPALVPFAEISTSQRTKEALFLAVVDSFRD